MTIYIVTANGKISQEAYKTLEEAEAFINSRHGNTGLDQVLKQDGYYIGTKNGTRYEIHDVRVV